MYVDPINYIDAESAVNEFTNELDPAALSLECVIGGGKKKHSKFSVSREP